MTVGDPGGSAVVDPGTTVGDLGEAAIIERIRRRTPAAPDWVPTGIGDDAAVVEPARGALDVVTTDTLVEGVHFDRSFMSAADVGHRTLAVNLSDLAAMGATPRAAVLSLVLPETLAAADLDGMVEGLLALAAQHRVALVGGNVTRTHGPLVLGVTAVGAVRRRRVLTRDGGRPGDELWVTGTVGAAAAGLAALRRAPAAGGARPGLADGTAGAAGERRAADAVAGSIPDLDAGTADGRREPAAETTADADLVDCIERYRRPEPRVRVGTLLGRNRVARAGIDLSDGLADGLRQLARASGAGAVVDAAAIPVAPRGAALVRRKRGRPGRRGPGRGGRLRAADRGPPPPPPGAPHARPSLPRRPRHPHRRTDEDPRPRAPHAGRRTAAPAGLRALPAGAAGRRPFRVTVRAPSTPSTAVLDRELSARPGVIIAKCRGRTSCRPPS